MAELTLVSNKICPFAQRAWLTVLQKQVQFTFRHVDLKDKEPFFTQTYLKAFAHDPKSNGKVPILVHGDNVLTQSDLVSWYVAETFATGSQLIPENTLQRAKMRRFIQEYGGKTAGAFYSMMGYKKKSQEQQQQIRQNITNTFATLESQIVGPYVLGQTFSLADILIYPWFERWCVLQSLFQLNVPAEYHKVHAFIKAMQGRQSVKKTRAQVSDEFFIQSYRQYMQ